MGQLLKHVRLHEVKSCDLASLMELTAFKTLGHEIYDPKDRLREVLGRYTQKAQPAMLDKWAKQPS